MIELIKFVIPDYEMNPGQVDFDNLPIKGYADPIDDEEDDSSEPDESVPDSSEPDESILPDESAQDSIPDSTASQDKGRTDGAADTNPATGKAAGIAAAAAVIMLTAVIIIRKKR